MTTDTDAELVDRDDLDAVTRFSVGNSQDIADLEEQLNRISLALGDLLDDRASELKEEIAALEERKAEIEDELDDDADADTNEQDDDQPRGYQ